jgi:poly(hydroxyalkanoate) granule-associated protein
MSEAQTFEKARRDLTSVASAGRNLWLAGLGVVAEAEAGGRDLFGRLVERGRPMEERRRKTLEKVGERTNETVRDFGKLVQDTLEYETKGVLQRLGLLTRDDVEVLAVRLEALSKKIDELSARQETAPLVIAVAGDSMSELDELNVEPATVSAPKARRPRHRKQ